MSCAGSAGGAPAEPGREVLRVPPIRDRMARSLAARRGSDRVAVCLAVPTPNGRMENRLAVTSMRMKRERYNCGIIVA